MYYFPLHHMSVMPIYLDNRLSGPTGTDNIGANDKMASIDLGKICQKDSKIKQEFS